MTFLTQVEGHRLGNEPISNVINWIAGNITWFCDRTDEGEEMTGQPSGFNRSLQAYLRLTMKGFCMGAADVIPGVSGGTMAFILGTNTSPP